jgi:solute:Na+ symporter, SSS family
MVVVAGVFMAPTLLPLMAALVVRKLSWQGALAGFILGWASGFAMLGVKAWYLPHVNVEWVRSGFDGITILVNAAMTIIGMYVGRLAFGTTIADRQRMAAIFREVEEAGALPVAMSAEHVYLSPISKITLAVGVLLATAGIIGTTRSARLIDVAVALILILLGAILFYRSRKSQVDDLTVDRAEYSAAHPDGKG